MLHRLQLEVKTGLRRSPRGRGVRSHTQLATVCAGGPRVKGRSESGRRFSALTLDPLLRVAKLNGYQPASRP